MSGRVLGKRLKWALGCAVVAGMAQAAGVPRPISINGAALHPVIESKWLPSGHEGLPVWFLPRLGIQTRNDPQDLWLVYKGSSLHWTVQTGKVGHWTGASGAERLSPPESYGAGGSLHIPLDALRLLGVPLQGKADTLDVTVSRAAHELPSVSLPSVISKVGSHKPSPSVKAAANTVPKPQPSVAAQVVTIPPPLPKPVAAQPQTRQPQTSTPKPSTLKLSTPKPSTPNAAKPAPLPAAPVASVMAILPSAPTASISRTAVSIAPPVASVQVTSLASPSSAPTSPAAAPSTANTSAQPNPVQPNAAQPNPVQPSPEVPLIGPRITGIRSSLTTIRNVTAQRIVIDLTGPVQYSVQHSNTQGGGQVSVFLLGASAAPAQLAPQKLESGDLLSLTPSSNAAGRPGLTLRLQMSGAVGQIQTLQNPDRLVIDSAASTGDSSPPPINEAALPQGVTLRSLGAISLLSFDPALFQPRVVAAPVSSALSVAELVRRVGGVAGVNGGYFDPPSSLSVDFVTVAGQMLSSSLEKRAAVGFEPQGKVLFGYPRPRYFAEGDFGSVLVNTVTSRPQPTLLSAFVGDGRTAVGGSGLTTLLVDGGKVIRVSNASLVPAVGIMSLSFDPARFPSLPRSVGAKLNLRLDYQSQSWDNVRDGLAAGPLLLQGGKVVLDPVREAFNIYTGIWRPTRQVAFALYQNQPTIAFMDFGTPESFASALQRVGVSDALRLDSGSSATAFVAGGYLGSGGYLNTVWSRPVPNAIVFVPR